MGLDTFPLLQNQTSLITDSNNVFKLKLEYEEISQEKKQKFVRVVSERTAHCQIEDVIRAVLYSIEREVNLSPIQTDNFFIYPEVYKWPIEKKVMFIVDGKLLSCYKDLILLKLTCKDVAVPENDQVAVSPLSKRKWSSRRLSSDMQQITSNSETSKTATTMLPPTDKKNAHTAVKNGTAITETPVLGINNSRGGQSPASINKITMIIHKHSSSTHLPTTNDQINCARNKSIHHKTSPETYILPDRCTNQRTKFLTNPERVEYPEKVLGNRGPQLVNLMDTADESESPQKDCPQYEDKQINIKARPSFKEGVKDINKTVQDDKAMQLEVQSSEASDDDDDDSNIELSRSNDDSNIGQSGSNDNRNLAEISPLLRTQSNKINLCSGKRSRNKNISNEEELDRRIVTRSQERKNVNNTLMLLGIKKKSKKHSNLQTERQLLRNKADAIEAKIEKNNIQKYVQESRSVNQASRYTEGSQVVTGKKYQGNVDDMRRYSNSLEIAGKNVAEISDDGSIVNESVSYTDDERFGSVTINEAVRGQIGRRKNTGSLKYSECDMDRQRVGSPSDLLQEFATVRTIEHARNLKQITDQDYISDDSTPAKRQTRRGKAHGSSSNSGSIESLNKEQARRLERDSSCDGSSMSLRSPIGNSRGKRIYGLHHGPRYTDVANSPTITARDSKNSIDRRKRLRIDVEKKQRDFPKISCQSPRVVKKGSMKIDSKAQKGSQGVKTQRKVVSGFNGERTHNTSANKSASSNSSSAKKSLLTRSSSQHGPKHSSRTMQSKKSSLPNLPESRNNRVTTSRTDGKLLKAQRRLLNSKDGVWLF